MKESAIPIHLAFKKKKETLLIMALIIWLWHLVVKFLQKHQEYEQFVLTDRYRVGKDIVLLADGNI